MSLDFLFKGLLVVVGLLIVGVIGIGASRAESAVRVMVATSVSVHIGHGDSINQIALLLKEHGLIRSTSAFKLYSLATGAAHRFQPGRYTFAVGDRVADIVRSLVRGPGLTTVIIPEGLTLKDIDATFARAGIIRSGDFIAYSTDGNAVARLSERYPFLRGHGSLEGFLFPDTYRLIPGTSAESIVEAMLTVFAQKAYPLLSSRSDWYTILTLASVLEKEVVSARDRSLVADIIQRRISLGMALQIDATVLYAKCLGAYTTCASRQLNKSDFLLTSPYNTYRYRGLPPTPIANPGRSAIEAALRPLRNAYLYYLSDSTTHRTIFSKTFTDHDDNRAVYVRR